jgi:hypothetical protein
MIESWSLDNLRKAGRGLNSGGLAMRLWKGIACGLVLAGFCIAAPRALAAVRTAAEGIVSVMGSVKDPIEPAPAFSLAGSTDGVLLIGDRLSINPAPLSDDSACVPVHKAAYRAARTSGEIGIGGVDNVIVMWHSTPDMQDTVSHSVSCAQSKEVASAGR